MRSKLAVAFAFLIIALLVVLSALFAWKQNPQDPVQAGEVSSQIRLMNAAGEVRFSHPRHGSASCVECHHKTSDPNPWRSCHDCHTSKGVARLRSQAVFHLTCIECHERTLKSGKTAPSRRCGSCHNNNPDK